mgnify:FL=1
MNSLWLTEKQLKEFTGIYMGHRGKDGELITFHQLQAEYLRSKGIPFHQNLRGRCLVAKEVVLGMKPPAPPKPVWQPKMLRESA